MSLNDRRRLKPERSGPWIGVAGLFIMLWFVVGSSRFAPWWGVLLEFVALLPSVVLVSRWARTRPTWAAFVPLGSFVVWILIAVIGVSAWGWEAKTAAPHPTSVTGP